MRFTVAFLLALVGLILAGACSNGDSDGGNPACPQGAERCACYPNNTCNAGLECASSLCVQRASGTAGTGGTPGSGGVGVSSASGGSSGVTQGSSQGGSSGAAGAAPVGSGGNGGSNGGSGGSGGDGGNAGTSGGSAGLPDASVDGAMCTNTQTDPRNCGQCGKVCRNADPIFDGACPPGGCCQAGKCAPYLGACFRQPDAGGFANCAEYCTSIGESCVEKGCAGGGVTWAGWGVSNRVGCDVYASIDSVSVLSCDMPIAWRATANVVRCCCTDTRP